MKYMDLLKFMMELVLIGPGCYDAIHNRIRYLISEKSGITDSIDHNFA